MLVSWMTDGAVVATDAGVMTTDDAVVATDAGVMMTDGAVTDDRCWCRG
jgi:hypothetical protein